MRPAFLKRLMILSILAAISSWPAAAVESAIQEGQTQALDAMMILKQAFDSRYECDTSADVELVMRDRRGRERRRHFETISKQLDGRMRTIGRVKSPEHLRGFTVMTVELQGVEQDTFIYLPSLDRVRRVTTAQRSNAFLGSDITYEDFERRRAEDFVSAAATEIRFQSEAAYRVRARPRYERSYDHVDFTIAKADWAILGVQYFKRGAAEPFRVISMTRSRMLEQGRYILPTRMQARNSLRGTTTEIFIRDLRINPQLDEQLFSVLTLEAKRPLE